MFFRSSRDTAFQRWENISGCFPLQLKIIHMKTTFLSLLLISSGWICAQPTDSLSPIKPKKHQLFTNLLPVLVPAVGAVPQQFSVRFGYERQVCNTWSFRGVVSFNTKNHIYTQGDYNVLAYSDTTMIREYEMMYGSPEIRLGIGLRKRWERPIITWYAGADIYGSFSKNSVIGQAATWRLDSAATAMMGEPVWLPEEESPSITRWVETRNHDLGISPFFGAEKNLGKRFSLSAQFGFDVFLRDTYWKRTYPDDVSFHYYSFNFDMGGLVNELALRYRF